MPICKKCTNKFPNKIIDSVGRVHWLRSRKYCYNCSPPGTHNTRSLDLPKGLCRLCGEQFDYNRSKGHRATVCNNCNGTVRRYKLKRRAIDYKGGKCNSCGYNKCQGAMEFHHIDKTSKKFEIGGSYNRSWKELQIELDKCILLCSNCHHELHYIGG